MTSLIDSGRRRLATAVLAVCASASPITAVEPELTVRQLIIRAPEARVLDIALSSPEDEPLANKLHTWVKDGSAKIVSELSGRLNFQDRGVLTKGKTVPHVVEHNQYTETATLQPAQWEDVFVGTSAEISRNSEKTYATSPHVDANWTAKFSPRDAAKVPWPIWWPSVKEPTVNWFEQTDFFSERASVSTFFIPGHDSVLGVFHPACAVAPGEDGSDPPSDQLVDVVLGQLNPTGDAVPPDDKLPPSQRFMVIGFGMRDRDAVELMSRRTAKTDRELLDALRRMQAAGTAKLRAISGMRTTSGVHSTMESVREHLYPTEMPTFPSAWEMRPVGTKLALEMVAADVSLMFEHHPAPPLRVEWRCALDSPKLVLWQPQFYVQKISTSVHFNDDGVALLGAMRTPDWHGGGDAPILGETLVAMATLQGAPVGLAATPGTTRVGEARGIETDAVVFEVSEKEAESWTLRPGRFDEAERLADVMSRVDGTSVKIAAHVNVCTQSGQRATVSDVAEVPTVSEVNAPIQGFEHRCRPTGIERTLCGTTWEVDAVVGPSGDLVGLNYTLKHHVAAPKQPDYRDLIAAVARDGGGNIGHKLPWAKFFEETWYGQATVADGGTCFLGTRPFPAESQNDRRLCAFLRVRVSR